MRILRANAYILSKMPAGKAALYLYYIPVLSTILGWLILGEVITLGFLFAGVLIILGVMIGTGALKPNPFWKIKKLSKTPIKGPIPVSVSYSRRRGRPLRLCFKSERESFPSLRS